MLKILDLSGGKDSTALAIESKRRGLKYDYIIYADTGKDWEIMPKHLDALEQYLGQKVIRLTPARSFDYLMFEHIKTRGKNKGKKGYGWATMLCRWCTSELKTRTINNFCKTLGDECVHYIGIASDEPKRLKPDKYKRYPLADWGITEKQALQICYEAGFNWDGLYDVFSRLSCWCYPLKNLQELRQIYQRYPEKWAELREMDERAYNQFRCDYSIEQLEQKFIMEGLSIYGHRK